MGVIKRAGGRKVQIKRAVAVPSRRLVATPARRAPAAIRKAPKQRSENGSAFRTTGTTLGGMLGTALGGPAGGVMGSMLGRGAGAMFSKLMGHGDYSVSNVDQLKENNLVLGNAAQIPQFGSGKVACKFVHREYLGDIFSSSTAGAFKIDNYSINPGLVATFPWLSGVVGAKFQQYRINGMTFEYRSMSSDALNSTNTALGTVIMSTDYDSASAAFTSKQEMENTEFGVSCKPSVNMLHGIECQRSQTPVSELYIRAFDVPSGKDIRLYDLGRFSIATTGFQGTNVNCGELWVSYDIDAFKAIEQVPGYLSPYANYIFNSATSAAAPMGTSQSLTTWTNSADQIGITFDSGSAHKMQWPVMTDIGSTYLINFYWVKSGAPTLTVLPVVTSGNGMYFSTSVNFFTPDAVAGPNVSNVQSVYAVQYKGGATPAALPYVNIANFTWAGSMVSAGVNITQVSGLFGGAFTATTAALPPLTEDENDKDETSPDYVEIKEEQKKPVIHRKC